MIAISLTRFLLYKIPLTPLNAGVRRFNAWGGRAKKVKIPKSHEDKANELSIKNNPKTMCNVPGATFIFSMYPFCRSRALVL